MQAFPRQFSFFLRRGVGVAALLISGTCIFNGPALNGSSICAASSVAFAGGGGNGLSTGEFTSTVGVFELDMLFCGGSLS